MSNNEQLKKIILDLIKKQKEGDYWDFKESVHTNNIELVHDILALANNTTHKGDRYLIFGITDNFEYKCVKDDKNRKDQASYIDLLRGKKFAGDIRPEILLETIELERNEIDILVIKDLPQKPYFLSEDTSKGAKTIGAGQIFTRNGDTNTPINKTADLYHIEKMWKQRFGLDLSPKDRMISLLMKPSNWFKDIGNKDYSYNIDYPEFRIEFRETKKFGDYEGFEFFYPNHNAFLGNAVFYYHSTSLFENEYVYLDEMRLMLANPNIGNICRGKLNATFYYYKVQNDLSYVFTYFLTDTEMNFSSRGGEAPFLIFKNDEELDKYRSFVEQSEDQFLKYDVEDDVKHNLNRDITLDDKSKRDFLTVQSILRHKHFYERFKQQNPSTQSSSSSPWGLVQKELGAC